MLGKVTMERSRLTRAGDVVRGRDVERSKRGKRQEEEEGEEEELEEQER
jgi:hypothetical protein